MIHKIEAQKRFIDKISWLKTYWLFSFAHYYDPENLNFGVLRVFNDDIIKSKNGFPMHPHKDMEIITFVFKGVLTHEDTMGNKGEVAPYEMQRMNAASGVQHSEYNNSNEDLHLYQIWFFPMKRLEKPEYSKVKINSIDKNNKKLLASHINKLAEMEINADADIYFLNYEKGEKENFYIESRQKVFIYIKEGKLKIDGVEFNKGDQARIENYEKKELNIEFLEETEAIFMNLGDL